MKPRKVVGLDAIPIKVRKCLDKVGIGWLKNLFKKFGKIIRCLMSGGRVLPLLKTKVIFRIAQIIED